MVGVFCMYHVDNIAECAIKIVITAFEREIQLIADAPYQEGRMMFVFADYLDKGLILIPDLVGVMIEAQRVCISKRQTNNNGQMVRFCVIQYPPEVDRIPYPYRITSRFVEGSQVGISAAAFYKKRVAVPV